MLVTKFFHNLVSPFGRHASDFDVPLSSTSAFIDNFCLKYSLRFGNLLWRKDSLSEASGKVERNSNSNHCVSEEISQEIESSGIKNFEKSENRVHEKYFRRKSSTKEIMETEVKAETAAAILDSRIDLHASLSTQDSGFHSYSIRFSHFEYT